MLTLFLCRHAKSSWAEPGLSDKDRPLNERGKSDAPIMGRMLESREESVDLVISSPAKRALKTAKLISDELGYNQKDIIIDNRIYMAGIADFIEVLKECRNKDKTIMLFSHNYGITDFANYVSGSSIENIPTCGIVKIKFDFRNWEKIKKEKGKLEYFIYPKMFKHGI
ncbi:MAG: histidine phosphatase family protein [Ignavibacteria bacterium]|nr:histidine phosphatase family protein [Ignavibacteria bacterium]